MICPNCGKDYKDVPEGSIPGHFYKSDGSFGRKERRFGMLCNNCGYCAEFISKPSGLPYKKRDLSYEDSQMNMFGDEDNEEITEKLLSEIEFIYNKTRGIYKPHLSVSVKEIALNNLEEITRAIRKELPDERG